MAWYEAFAARMIGAVLMLMALGLPVAFASIAADVLGGFLFLGSERGVAQLITTAPPRSPTSRSSPCRCSS